MQNESLVIRIQQSFKLDDTQITCGKWLSDTVFDSSIENIHLKYVNLVLVGAESIQLRNGEGAPLFISYVDGIMKFSNCLSSNQITNSMIKRFLS